jgi:hypothetical protein
MEVDLLFFRATTIRQGRDDMGMPSVDENLFPTK